MFFLFILKILVPNDINIITVFFSTLLFKSITEINLQHKMEIFFIPLSGCLQINWLGLPSPPDRSQAVPSPQVDRRLSPSFAVSVSAAVHSLVHVSFLVSLVYPWDDSQKWEC